MSFRYRREMPRDLQLLVGMTIHRIIALRAMMTYPNGASIKELQIEMNKLVPGITPENGKAMGDLRIFFNKFQIAQEEGVQPRRYKITEKGVQILETVRKLLP